MEAVRSALLHAHEEAMNAIGKQLLEQQAMGAQSPEQHASMEMLSDCIHIVHHTEINDRLAKEREPIVLRSEPTHQSPTQNLYAAKEPTIRNEVPDDSNIRKKRLSTTSGISEHSGRFRHANRPS